MATATKQAVTVVEYTLTLTNTEAHELVFYLAQRGTTLAYNKSSVGTTNGIHDALRKVMP